MSWSLITAYGLSIPVFFVASYGWALDRGAGSRDRDLSVRDRDLWVCPASTRRTSGAASRTDDGDADRLAG